MSERKAKWSAHYCVISGEKNGRSSSVGPEQMNHLLISSDPPIPFVLTRVNGYDFRKGQM